MAQLKPIKNVRPEFGLLQLLRAFVISDRELSQYEESRTYNLDDITYIVDEITGKVVVYKAIENGVTGPFDPTKWTTQALDIPEMKWSNVTETPTTLDGYGITDGVNVSEVVTVATANKILKLNANGLLPASVTGNAGTATKLATPRAIGITGDGTATASFDGSAAVNLSFTLANSGVAAGTYGKVTVDAKGRVTAAAVLVAADIPNLDWSKITTGKPTTLAGYGITDGIIDTDATTVATANKLLYLNSSAQLPASITGNAATATTLANARTIAVSGDGTGSASFNGSANATIALTLANSGVAAGTYGKVTVDTKGRVTAGMALVAADIPSLDWSKITTGKPTTLAGYGITDGATRSYVDGLTQGIKRRAAVHAATTVNIALTGIQTMDGVVLVAGDTVLVKNQTDAKTNGIYVVASGAWVRDTEYDEPYEFESAFVFVQQGTTQSGTGWMCASGETVVIGTSAINFTQFSTAGVIDADGSTTVKSGIIISMKDGIVSPGTYAKTTVDTYGRVTAGSALVAADIPNLSWSKITSAKPTTLAGYGITDAIIDTEATTVATANKLLYLNASAQLPASITGNAVTATTLANARTLSYTGDATGSLSFNGSANVSAALTLANSGVTAGTYAKVTVDAKGRVTAGVAMVAADVPNLDWTKITTGKPTTLAGYGITDALNKTTGGDVNGHIRLTGTAEVQVLDPASVNDSVSLGWLGSVARLRVSGVGAGSANGFQIQTVSDKIMFYVKHNGQVVNYTPQGTPAFEITSSTHIPKLHSDLLDGYHASSTAVASTIPVYNASAQLVGSITGNAATATKLATARNISLGGDATGNANYDGSANSTITVALVNSGVTAGTYGMVTVDAKGRVTAGSNPTSLVLANFLETSLVKVRSTTTPTTGYSLDFNEAEGSLDFIYYTA